MCIKILNKSSGPLDTSLYNKETPSSCSSGPVNINLILIYFNFIFYINDIFEEEDNIA